MELSTPEEKAFLFELHTRTGGDIDAQASMYEIGEALGLERDEAGRMAESLLIQEYAELKTLSGGMGITDKGLTVLDMKPQAGPGEEPLSLGKGRVLEARGRKVLERIIEEVKGKISGSGASYDILEEMIVDVKTIEAQLFSPCPKTAVFREVLKSLLENIRELGDKDLAFRLTAMISS